MRTEIEQTKTERGVYRAYVPGNRWSRLFQRMPLLFWRLGLAWLIGRWMLVLTTVGRKSGLPRQTMINYYRVAGRKYAYSGFGPRSDWFRNLEADPHVTVQTTDGTQTGLARRVTDPDELVRVMHVLMASYPAAATMLRQNWGDSPMTDEAIAASIDRFYLVAFDLNGDALSPA
jgi:deazaflavin-dependent oxidoreductase (nitroreductase family)